MLTVTKPALDRLIYKLVRKKATDDVALRFRRREGGWKLRLDQESDGDTVITHDGRKVLLLDKTVSRAMANMRLETRKSGRRSQLRLRRKDRSKD